MLLSISRSSRLNARFLSIDKAAREKEKYDVVITGGGVAGLCAAIRLQQLASLNKHKRLKVCVLEKGEKIGSHILSGCVLDPIVLDEILPEWKNAKGFNYTPVTSDNYSFLMGKHIPGFRIPIPRLLKNTGKNIIVSLGNLCKWLSNVAEQLGVDVFSGFGASEILYNKGNVIGVATSDTGIDKNGHKLNNYSPGVEFHGRLNIFAEGCRGHLSEELIKKFNLDKKCTSKQSYGLGIKELWKVPSKNCPPKGSVFHTFGWPQLPLSYGGSFLYSCGDNIIALGHIVGLDYRNPYQDPFQDLQKFKTHYSAKRILQGGKLLEYGARTMTEGGIQALPSQHFPGGLIIGDSAGIMNMAKLKGAHLAMKSGTLAAELSYPLLANRKNQVIHVSDYDEKLRRSWIGKELIVYFYLLLISQEARNIRPAFGKFGLLTFMPHSALDMFLLHGRLPYTIKRGNQEDYMALKPAKHWSVSKKLFNYPKPDGKLIYSRSQCMAKTGVNVQQQNQPSHLKIKKGVMSIDANKDVFDCPETRFCPAGVYQYRKNKDGKMELVIEANDCLHCKACTIKDPTQCLSWTLPQGIAGPNYQNM